MVAVAALALGPAFHYHGDDGGSASTCLACKIAGSGKATLDRGGGSLPGAESFSIRHFITQTIPHTFILTGLHPGRAPPARV